MDSRNLVGSFPQRLGLYADAMRIVHGGISRLDDDHFPEAE